MNDPSMAPPLYSQTTDFGTANNAYQSTKMPPPAPFVVTTTPAVVGTTTAVHSVQPRRISSRQPTSTVCQHCNTPVVTQPRAEVGLITWAIAGFLIVVGLGLGCCLIPFCIDECKDCHHECPNCHRTIDVYKVM